VHKRHLKYSVLRNKLLKIQEGRFFGNVTEDISEAMIPQGSNRCKSDFLKLYEKALRCLKKSFDFTENNLFSLLKNLNLKSELSFKHLKETVKALNLESDISLDELYEEFCLSIYTQVRT
jgi:hypothetical protein